MDTGSLKKFAAEARNILMQGVAHRLQALGFDADGKPVEEPIAVEGGAIFMGDTISQDFYDKWLSLQAAIERHNIKFVAEEAAYTWFNRLMAIRIMVKNQMIPPVLQYESEGVYVPILVTEARQGRLPVMKEDERRKLMALLDDDSKTAEQFAILIVAFCHATPVINKCFGQISDYTELLLPSNILSEGGFIDLINHTDFIAEEDYKSPELIGWLYQFYISEKKDEVFAKKGKVEKDEIPAATQIFTPNWIVKYMVQNTIGRIYLDNNPYEEDIQKKWKYLVEPTEKTPEEKILHYDDLKKLKFGDLACGSGHILNEGFDILYDLYVLEGYSRSQAIENIFHYNLTGIDIDTRAKQLAQFALMLKACQKDRSFLDAHIMPRVYDMPEPYPHKEYLRETLPHFFLGGNQEMIQEVCDAIDLMDQAQNLGSIMKFDISEKTRNAIMVRMEEYEKESRIPEPILQLMPYMWNILALTEKYSALVMNPPYMGSGNMNAELSDYIKHHYEEGKADLFSTFMILAINCLAEKGKYGMINMHSWMFLSSFERLRQSLLDNYHIDSLLHLGPRTFDELSGEVVQNAAFVVSNVEYEDESNNGIYYRLVDGKCCREKERLFVDAQTNHTENIYYPNIKQQNFEKIPGCPIGYWVSEKIRETFTMNRPLSAVCRPTQGLATADNGRFIRSWFEVSKCRIGFDFENAALAARSQKKWFPCNKGGGQRKWYGNQNDIINWENDGYEIKNFKGAVIRNEHCYFKPTIAWNMISSGFLSFRYFPKGFILNNASNGIPCKDLFGMLGFLSSKYVAMIADIINPTVNLSNGVVATFPYMVIDNDDYRNIVGRNINITKLDWDAHETSWDFKQNPLLENSGAEITEEGETTNLSTTSDSLENQYNQYVAIWEQNFYQLHQNEEELNRQFIEIYGLQDELTPDVPLDEITILQQGEIKIEDGELIWNADVVMKQLISYAIGCMMGRYSIDKPGLILANQGDSLKQFNEVVPNSRFEPDDDGIIPLMSAQSDFADNATVRFKQWLVTAFGEETLVENLNFIEKCLGKSVDDYFVKDFWKDHKKMYQNRPIYWLFSSKKGAFQCLAYMHRMDAYTAERIRTKYLLPHIEWLVQKQKELEDNLANLNSRERKELDNIGKQIQECREYHDKLHVIADQQIAFDLDDGVVVNYAKFGDVLAKIK